MSLFSQFFLFLKSYSLLFILTFNRCIIFLITNALNMFQFNVKYGTYR